MCVGQFVVTMLRVGKRRNCSKIAVCIYVYMVTMLRVGKRRNCSKIAGRDKNIFSSSKMSKLVLVSTKPLIQLV